MDPNPFQFLCHPPQVDQIYHPEEALQILLLDPGGVPQAHLQVQNPQVFLNLWVPVRKDLHLNHHSPPIPHGFGVLKAVFPVALVLPLLLRIWVCTLHPP